MDDINIQVFGLVKDVENLTRRVEMCEDTAKTIQQLLISVQQLANSVEHLVKEQTAQGERIKALEQAPKDRSTYIWRTIFASLASGLIALVLAKLL